MADHIRVTSSAAGLIASALRVGAEGIEGDELAVAASGKMAELMDKYADYADRNDEVVYIVLGNSDDFSANDPFQPGYKAPEDGSGSSGLGMELSKFPILT